MAVSLLYEILSSTTRVIFCIVHLAVHLPLPSNPFKAQGKPESTNALLIYDERSLPRASNRLYLFSPRHITNALLLYHGNLWPKKRSKETELRGVNPVEVPGFPSKFGLIRSFQQILPAITQPSQTCFWREFVYVHHIFARNCLLLLTLGNSGAGTLITGPTINDSTNLMLSD